MASSSPTVDYSADVPASPSEGSEQHDPFFSTTSHPAATPHHRFSNFDPQLFAFGPNASPAQAKLALEAHLAETDRRMEEAGKLGTALVHQRKELTERLKEVEKLQAEGELSQDLRQRLADIEKEYNEVARESARAFLPKQRVPSNEAGSGSPFVPEGKGGRVSYEITTRAEMRVQPNANSATRAAFCEPLQVRGTSYCFSYQTQRT